MNSTKNQEKKGNLNLTERRSRIDYLHTLIVKIINLSKEENIDTRKSKETTKSKESKDSDSNSNDYNIQGNLITSIKVYFYFLKETQSNYENNENNDILSTSNSKTKLNFHNVEITPLNKKFNQEKHAIHIEIKHNLFRWKSKHKILTNDDLNKIDIVLKDHSLEEMFNLICKSLFATSRPKDQFNELININDSFVPNPLDTLKTVNDIKDNKKLTIHYNVGEKLKHFNLELESVEDKSDVIDKLIVAEENYIKLINKIKCKEEQEEGLIGTYQLIQNHINNLKKSYSIS